MPIREPGAGALRERIAFERRVETDDGYGNSEAEFAPVFACWARLVPQLGGEQVMASRLGGRQPFVLTVRQSPDTRQVTTDWRARNVRSGVVYNIRSVIDPTGRRAFFDMLVEAGVAT